MTMIKVCFCFLNLCYVCSNCFFILQVVALCDSCHGNGMSNSYARVSFASVTSAEEGADYIDHTTYFSLDVVCKGTIYIF